ncbi:MAG: NUDIX hydrolase [Pseudomonadota bacterium]
MSIHEQIAALPVQINDSGSLKVLLITSRETRRWVTPKGWPMKDKTPWEAAEIEALEEAGVSGRVASEQLGCFHYDKVLEDGSALTCKVSVYPLLVEKLHKNWKERSERTRRWFSPRGAAKAVHEDELKDLLSALSKKVLKQTVEA